MPLSKKEILDFIKTQYEKQENEKSVLEADCRVITFMLDHCEISIPSENRFFGKFSVPYAIGYLLEERLKPCDKEKADLGILAGEQTLAYIGGPDFGHTSAAWNSVLNLGIFGLKERLVAYQKHTQDKDKFNFYRLLIGVYEAALRFMARMATLAQSLNRTEMADSLFALTTRAPKSLYEAMQTTIVYYYLQNFFDGTSLRTLGRLDSLYLPFAAMETKENTRDLIQDFLKEIDTFGVRANIPFALGGTDINGKTLANELTYLMLQAYQNANTVNTKLHLLVSKDMPTDLLNLAFDGVRNNKNSIVFMSDEKIIQSLRLLGEEKQDAVDYHVVGCYECGGNGELTCSCNARLNIVKAIEYALNDGKDMCTNECVGLPISHDLSTFEGFYAEFIKQLQNLAKNAMRITDIYETHYADLHAAPILSATYESALEKGGDLYCDYAAKYNNSSINALGLATATDSIYAVKKLVYEDKTLSLSRFTEILKSDWENQEPLRLRIKNKFLKYGVANKEIDLIAKDIVDKLADAISGKPNAKGGVYRLGTFSIDNRWAHGATTAATPNGRKKGETLSQNATASFGADTQGATAHLISVATIDASRTPNGTVADIDLHASAVAGENGLNAMIASLKTYFELGGFCVHYNVLDSQMLKKAKLSPNLYPNLQVRLCGWNVLFNSLSETEKDEFITRSEYGEKA